MPTTPPPRVTVPRPVPSRSAIVHGTEKFSLNVIEFITVAVVGPLLAWLCKVNYDQLNDILGTLFGRDGTPG